MTHDVQSATPSPDTGTALSSPASSGCASASTPNTAPLLGRTLDELAAIAREFDLPPYAARQLAGWLYRRHAISFAEMTDLPLRARTRLAERYRVGAAPPHEMLVSHDGTRKYLFAVAPERCVETAWIPDRDRSTLCVSTQAGCRMRCRFCHTGRQRFGGDLSAAEILNQYRSLPERDRVSNIVVMGMGEPLDNWSAVRRALQVWTAPWGSALSPRRITVSTVGVLPALRELLAETHVHVAISLHTPFTEERAAWMPSERAHPIQDVLEALRSADWAGQRRLMFEYIVFSGLNDSPRHVRELARLLHGLPCRINLMRHHPWPGSSLPATDEATLFHFRDALERRGFVVTIRRSRGSDIAAACGQLTTARRPTTSAVAGTSLPLASDAAEKSSYNGRLHE